MELTASQLARTQIRASAWTITPAYDPFPGSTVGIWMRGVDALHDRLNERRSSVKILPPAVWVPSPEDMPGGRMMTVSDPFGNSLRFTEPLDQREREAVPDSSA